MTQNTINIFRMKIKDANFYEALHLLHLSEDWYYVKDGVQWLTNAGNINLIIMIIKYLKSVNL